MTRRSFATTALACLVAIAPGTARGATFQTGPLPSEFGGGILVFPSTVANVHAARQALSKLQLAVEKCLSKGVTNVSRGNASGVGACLHDPTKGALPKYAARIAALQAKPGSLPYCADFPARGPQVAERTRALHEWAYCGDPPGSPSGAFLDAAWPAL
jgi:hypothetical protein